MPIIPVHINDEPVYVTHHLGFRTGITLRQVWQVYVKKILGKRARRL